MGFKLLCNKTDLVRPAETGYAQLLSFLSVRPQAAFMGISRLLVEFVVNDVFFAHCLQEDIKLAFDLYHDEL